MQLPIQKYGLTFRLVEESDAAFILSLRTDQGRAKHLSATDNNLQKQIDWIRAYKEREKAGIEYYVLFEDDKQQPLGVVRAYDITTTTYTSGSWLIKPGCDEFASIKGDLFMMEFAKEELANKRCIFDVRKDNKKVLRFHKMFATITGEDELNYYFTLTSEDAKRKTDFLNPIIQPTI